MIHFLKLIHLSGLPADGDTAFVNSDIHDVPPFHIGREVDWYEIYFYCFSSSLLGILTNVGFYRARREVMTTMPPVPIVIIIIGSPLFLNSVVV